MISGRCVPWVNDYSICAKSELAPLKAPKPIRLVCNAPFNKAQAFALALNFSRHYLLYDSQSTLFSAYGTSATQHLCYSCWHMPDSGFAII